MKYIFKELAMKNKFAFYHVRIHDFHHEDHKKLVKEAEKFRRRHSPMPPIGLKISLG